MSRSRTIALAVAAVSALIPATEAMARHGFGSRPLAQPMRGADVRALQRLLTDFGLPTAIDGHFGRHTRTQVRAWEAAAGRPVNGRVGRREAVLLREAVAGREQVAGVAPEAQAEAAPVAAATIGPDGLALAAPGTPDVVKEIIYAANEIAKTPYKYGGGHAKWRDTGYDCSGSMSYALHGAGLLERALDSTGFMSWGEAGRGTWVTTYANAGHSYMVVAGLRFDTSGRRNAGTRWQADMRSARGYTVRRPAGL